MSGQTDNHIAKQLDDLQIAVSRNFEDTKKQLKDLNERINSLIAAIADTTATQRAGKSAKSKPAKSTGLPFDSEGRPIVSDGKLPFAEDTETDMAPGPVSKAPAKSRGKVSAFDTAIAAYVQKVNSHLVTSATIKQWMETNGRAAPRGDKNTADIFTKFAMQLPDEISAHAIRQAMS
jgi:hypothetical protein